MVGTETAALKETVITWLVTSVVDEAKVELAEDKVNPPTSVVLVAQRNFGSILMPLSEVVVA